MIDRTCANTLPFQMDSLENSSIGNLLKNFFTSYYVTSNDLPAILLGYPPTFYGVIPHLGFYHEIHLLQDILSGRGQILSKISSVLLPKNHRRYQTENISRVTLRMAPKFYLFQKLFQNVSNNAPQFRL